ncbi:hypothetical protein LCGC14_1373100 [marine sediment metagenome]|uniref:Uncharacterized protein n=1 Tax=marine sediment metagenome TaxID=412755 RepID=A0A0F9N6U1_9ZZZZ
MELILTKLEYHALVEKVPSSPSSNIGDKFVFYITDYILGIVILISRIKR